MQTKIGPAGRGPGADEGSVGWQRTLAVLWVAQVIAELAFSFALPFIPLYILDLGVTDPTQAALWAGVMAGGFALVMAVMAPVWGLAADRYGRRLMIQRALFGACLVIGGMALVQSPEQLLVLRLLQGSVTGVVATTSTVVSLTVPRARLTWALGLMHAAMFVGASIGPIAGGLISDAYGFRVAFAATGGLFFIGGVLVTLFVAEPPREPSERTAARPSLLGSMRYFLQRPELAAVIGLVVLIRFASLAPLPVLPLFVQQLAPETTNLATTTGLVVAASGIAATVSALGFGKVANRFGRRRSLMLCLDAAGVLSIPQAFAATVPQLLVLTTAKGLALGGMMPAVQSLFSDLTPAGQRGMAFGMLATASAIGNGAGPVVGSLIAAWFSVPAVFAVMAPLFLVGAWVVTVIPMRSGTESAEAVAPVHR